MHQGANRCANCGAAATVVYGDAAGRVRIHVCDECLLLMEDAHLWHLGDESPTAPQDARASTAESRS